MLGLNRWVLRVIAYGAFMTREYPPFRSRFWHCMRAILRHEADGDRVNVSLTPAPYVAPEGERGKPRVPPRWFIRTFWRVHRRIVRASRGRKGLWPPRPGKWGALWLTTMGRRSGEPRSVVLGYYEDGPNLVSMAMNGGVPRNRPGG